MYRNRDIKDGLSARKCVSYNDEWLCEAYMKVDFTKLTKRNFEQTIRDYLAFEIKHGLTLLEDKFKYSYVPVELDIKKWKEFKVEDLFIVERGKINNITGLAEGDCPIVSAYGENQGIAFFADEEPRYSNCLTASMNGSKTGYVTYHGYGFNANADCGVLIPKFNMDIYTGLFIATVMKQFSYKYIYGRKLTKTRLNLEIIKLPVNRIGKIDLEYMRSYMMSLPYSDKI